MKTLGLVTRTIVSLVIVAGAALAVVWMGKSEVPTRPPQRGGAPVVRTAIASSHDQGIRFDVDGVVVPFRQIEIAAQVGGRITYKAENCRTGRAVQQGELLIRVDQSDYQLEVARLEEELKQADAMLRELELEIVTADNQIQLTTEQLEIDQRQLDRNLRLSSTAAASQTELDTARRAELATRNTLQGLKDNRALLNQRLVRMESGKDLVEANLEKARLALERTEIFAPLDGIIVNENVEQDGYIQAGNTVITLQDTSQLDVTCKLHMRQMYWLWQSDPDVLQSAASEKIASEKSDERASDERALGADRDGSLVGLVDAYDFPETPASIIYQLGPVSYQWEGVLNRYDGAGIDNQTRMIPCRVHVDRPLSVKAIGRADPVGPQAKPPTLMTGMFVKVRITADPPIPLVRIPQEAIQPGNEVWTVVDGKLRRKEVRLATSGEDYVVAYQQEDGLQAGDRVVVSPVATPIEGLEVREPGEGAPAGKRQEQARMPEAGKR